MTLHNKNIILIGMPGSGKSTVGVILAKTIGFDFIDTDILISHEEKTTLQNIIDTRGIEEFLKIESRVTQELDCIRTVIATGGSVVLSDDAMERLQKIGTLVYLNVPYEEVKRRITDRETRGIAIKKDETLKDLYDMRRPLYEKYAEVTVDVSERLGSSEAVVAKIIEYLKHV